MMNCPFCGKLTAQNLDNCPHCGALMQKGPEKPLGGKHTPRQSCPSCKALVQEGDIICVACGTNLLTGQKVKDEKARGASKPGSNIKLLVIGLVLVIIVLLGAVFASILMRDPLKQALKLSEEGRNTEAITMLEKYVEDDATDARARFELGRLLWRVNQYTRAASSFDKAQALEPENIDMSYLTVISLAQQNMDATRDMQIRALDRASKNMKDGAKGPGEHRLLYLLGLANGSNDNVDEQVNALNAAQIIDPGDVDTRTHLGVALALRSEYDLAQERLEAALELEPQSAEIKAAAGYVARLSGDSEGAVESLSGALRSGGDVDSTVLVQLGVELISQGRYAEAESHLMRALSMDQNNLSAMFFHGTCLKALGRNFDALEVFQAIGRIDGEGPFAADAAVQEAQLFVAQDEVLQARSAIERAQLLGASGPVLSTVSGIVHTRTNELEAAQIDFNNAINADPSYPAAHLEVGLLYVRRSMLREGIRELTRYLELIDASERASSSSARQVESLVEQIQQTLGQSNGRSMATGRGGLS